MLPLIGTKQLYMAVNHLGVKHCMFSLIHLLHSSDVQYAEKLSTLQYFFNTDAVSNLNIFIADINIYRILMINILLKVSIY